MEYTILGKTGLKVSRLGFGGMRFSMKNGRIDRDLGLFLHQNQVFKSRVKNLRLFLGRFGGLDAGSFFLPSGHGSLPLLPKPGNRARGD